MLREFYRVTKKYGIRMTFRAATGIGVLSLLKKTIGYGIKRYAKNYIGGVLVNRGFTCITAGLLLITSVTKIVKYSKYGHSICAASWRAAHNIAGVPFIFCDYVVFGEPVSLCGPVDYNMLGYLKMP